MSDPIRQSPLSWPTGVARTKRPTPSAFGGGRVYGQHSIARGTQRVLHELDLFGVKPRDVIISSNMRYKADGTPYSNQAGLTDHGVAVYFPLAKRDTVMPCDRWDRVADNLWAIGLHLAAMRGMRRWGVGTMEQAFEGYLRLSANAGGEAIALGAGGLSRIEWWKVLEVPANADAEAVRKAFRRLAAVNHPDFGGRVEKMAEITRAKKAADQALGIAS